MTREELEEMKGFASILKSRLEDAQDTREDIHDKLVDLKETPFNYLPQEIAWLQILDTMLRKKLTNLSKAIEKLEKALNKVDVVE